MVAEAAIITARARNFRDRDQAGDEIDWTDVLDRTATALRTMTYHTPEAAAGMIGSPAGRAELAKTWSALLATERQLWRRRAAVALEISVLVLEV